MLVLKNKEIPIPEPYPKVRRKLPTAVSDGWDIFDDFKIRKGIDLCPQPGLQEDVVSSECNLIFLAGEATMGKTFSGYLKALKGINRDNYTAKLISKRLQDSKKGGSLIRDFKLVCEKFAGCEFSGSEYPTASWPQWNSSLQMMHMNFNTKNETEWKAFQDYAKKTNAPTHIGMKLPK